MCVCVCFFWDIFSELHKPTAGIPHRREKGERERGREGERERLAAQSGFFPPSVRGLCALGPPCQNPRASGDVRRSHVYKSRA